MDELVTLFNILSDKTRLRILLLLSKEELCVCKIFAALDMSQPRVSQHLAILKQARLIKDRRVGKWVHYRIADNEYSKRLNTILELVAGWLEDTGCIEEIAGGDAPGKISIYDKQPGCQGK